MLHAALSARLPLVGVRTTDLVHLELVVADYCEMAGRGVPDISVVSHTSTFEEDEVLVVKSGGTSSPDSEWPNIYTAAALKQATILLVNPQTWDPAIFDAGTLLPSPEMARAFVLTTVDDHTYETIQGILRGLTLLDINTILSLSFADGGGLSLRGLQHWRAQLNKTPGLEKVSSHQDFYIPDIDVWEWANIIKPSFFGGDPALVPRGLLVHGHPGTGKTEMARWIANQWDLPLYRIDLGATLSKYLGESENRFATAIGQLEQEAPCILLLDEIEKFFNTDGDAGATSRMLGGLLWWLQEHQSRIFTVMTTNSLESLPSEVYRPGRIDGVFKLQGTPNPKKQQDFVKEACKAGDHPELAFTVYAQIKKLNSGLVTQADIMSILKHELQLLQLKGEDGEKEDES